MRNLFWYFVCLQVLSNLFFMHFYLIPSSSIWYIFGYLLICIVYCLFVSLPLPQTPTPTDLNKTPETRTSPIPQFVRF